MSKHETRWRPDRGIDRFDDDATRSFTLPARDYIDPAIHELEQAAVFEKSWQYVAHASEVEVPGRYVTASIGRQRVFVLRSKDGELRGFFNVCMHRGHSLLSGSGTIGQLITCPYHAWAYGHDGSLAGARMSDRMEDFNFDDFSLAPVAVEIFCGLVFVNLDPEPMSMADTYPGLSEAIHELYPEPSSLAPTSPSTFDIAANWKNVGDNLLECYHCHPAHHTFVELIDMDTYRNDTFENWSIQSGGVNTVQSVYDVSQGEGAFASVFMWPNLSIGRLPGQRGLFVFHFVPTATEQTLQTLTYLRPPDEPTESEVSALDWFDNVLGPEDVSLVEDVQIGLHSLGYHQGRFICIPDRPEISEHAVHHFHLMVRAARANHLADVD